MTKKIDIGQNAKVKLQWNVVNTNYSKEMEDSIITKFAKKYDIPVKNISLEVNYNASKKDGIVYNENVENIYDPKFQENLIVQYIDNKNVENIEINDILEINSKIDSLIDYNEYNQGKRYTIKWIKWDNFLSYGPDNYFDFTQYNGLVLLNGNPANKSGKSTFAYDLLYFLMYGKGNNIKAKKLSDLFNNYMPDNNTLNVEGCINIDGDDYIINRTLTRSKRNKNKIDKNEVEYYRVQEDGSYEKLEDFNAQEESVKATNKVIKDAIGSENDFNMIISANAKDLDNIISLTETEKGRLLFRWIGLSVIEAKEKTAKEEWKTISSKFVSNGYNLENLKNEIEKITQDNKNLEEENNKLNEINENFNSEIEKKEKERNEKLTEKGKIEGRLDNTATNENLRTLEGNLERIKRDGNNTKNKFKEKKKDIADLGIINTDDEYEETKSNEYNKLEDKNKEIYGSLKTNETTISFLKKEINDLKYSESCPTCGRKYDNIDNTQKIKDNENEIKKLESANEEIGKELKDNVEKKIEIDNILKNIRKRKKYELELGALDSQIQRLKESFYECEDKIKECKEKIKNNEEDKNKFDIIESEINALNATINQNRTTINKNNNLISQNMQEIGSNNSKIEENKKKINKIEEERKLKANWELYLETIGKDGISRLVLRNTLPIINNELNRILNDVSDFKVEVVMDEKNDIDFLLIRDGIETRLSAASGLEKTQAALALRVVLGNMSRLSRPPFILLDEVLGTVAKENYDDMKKLYDRIVEYYDFILHICHIDLDWYNDGNVITVVKNDNLSYLNNKIIK